MDKDYELIYTLKINSKDTDEILGEAQMVFHRYGEGSTAMELITGQLNNDKIKATLRCDIRMK